MGERVYQYIGTFFKICGYCYEEVIAEWRKQYIPVFAHVLIHKEPDKLCDLQQSCEYSLRRNAQAISKNLYMPTRHI